MKKTDVRQWIFERIESGEDIPALAAELDVTPRWLEYLAQEHRSLRRWIDLADRASIVKARRSRRRPIDENQQRRVCELFDSGKYIDAIASEVGVAIEVVYRTLRKHRPDRPRLKPRHTRKMGRPSVITESQQQRVCELFDSGTYRDEIVAEVGVSAGAVSRILRKHRPNRPRLKRRKLE